MKQIFFPIAILCNIAIIYFGLKSTVHTDFLSNEVTMLASSLDGVKSDLKNERLKVKDAEKKYSDLEALKQKVQVELKEKMEEASDLAMQLAKEKQKRAQLERKLKKAEKQIKTLKLEVDQEKEKSKKLEKRLERMANRLEKESDDKQMLLNRLNNSIQERDSLKKELENITKRGTQYSLAEITVSEQKQYSGIVLNINNKLQFCIISIGKNEEIVPGIELVIHRGSKLIGKVKVDRVFDKMSSANITSITENEEIFVEDRVRKF